jgi:hypothetical protein
MRYLVVKMAEKRKLPMIQSRPDDDTPSRPRSHWIGFGLVAIFTLWVPLAALAESIKHHAIVSYLGDRSGEDQIQLAIASLSDRDHTRLTAVIVIVPMLALAFASLGGGYLVGRYGGDAGIREGALAGAAAAFVAVILAWVGSGFAWAPLISIAIAAPFGALGARMGLKARRV